MRGQASQSEFAAQIGVSIRTIQRWENKNDVPKGDVLLKLHELYNVNLHWLLTGQGDSPKQLGQNQFGTNENPTEAEYILENGVPKEIPAQIGQTGQATQNASLVFIPIALPKLSKSGGELIFEETSEKFFAFQKSWLQCMATKIDNLILLSMRGDSMAPLICSGDMVMIDRGRRDITEGCTYAIGMSEMIYLKKLLVMPNEKVRLISENKDAYESFEIDRQDLRILGEVIWYARQLG